MTEKLEAFRQEWRQHVQNTLDAALLYDGARTVVEEKCYRCGLLALALGLQILEGEWKKRGVFRDLAWLDDFSKEARHLFAAVYVAADEIPDDTAKQDRKIAVARHLPALAREYEVSLRD